MSVPVTIGDSFQPGTPGVLFTHDNPSGPPPAYSVSPNGKRFCDAPTQRRGDTRSNHCRPELVRRTQTPGAHRVVVFSNVGGTSGAASGCAG